MAIPDYQTLMLPVLRIAAKGETRVPEVAEKMADELGLAPDEREEMLPSGRQRVLHNRIHWAKFYMTKAGLIDSPARGRFVASEAGRELLASNPTRLDTRMLMDYPGFREFYESSHSKGSSNDRVSDREPAIVVDETETPEEQIEAAYRSLNAALRADLLDRIRENSPAFFEKLIVDLLVAMGYGGSHKNAAEQLGRSGDGGVDGVINEDRLGLDRIYVQAKRYAEENTICRPAVQGFVGSLVGFGATKGVFVTASTFSSGAVSYAKNLPQRVILIDGNRLADLMIEHGVGTRPHRTIQVQRLDEDFFSEDG
ncbi:restriction system protein [Rhodobium orientis]|uniref:Restriction endonuclease n=1 Tax=Rhodobium orientis TaxID=34017 RepID=A0A327JMJ7_9HYPH|nr:restriction endonuclease [Rhodobium orientis]MBB4302378.1 restriction system protein [Rhodobium orientis]MBK5949082.1 restriction endonuclease [Rhodobium orientis]RAI26593.1 restriction endonuclease [Rhodobium orientis]